MAVKIKIPINIMPMEMIANDTSLPDNRAEPLASLTEFIGN
jgi:hypothetical protein